MADKPTKLPRWATVPTPDPVFGGTNVIEPTEQRKDTGWLKEYPDAQTENWFKNLTYQWLDYLKSVTDNDLFYSTGDIRYSFKIISDLDPQHWLLLDDGSLGRLVSLASHNDEIYKNLFIFLWDRTSDLDCPVSGGRGATALDDWDADKILNLPKTLTRSPMSTGQGAGITTNLRLGQSIGEENHQLTVAELASHKHNYNEPHPTIGTHIWDADGSPPKYKNLVQTSSDGGDVAHNTMHQSFGINIFIKL